MKPKRMITIAIAAAAVAAAAYLAISRGKSASSIIKRLEADPVLKGKLTHMVAYIRSGWTEEARAQIREKARAEGRTTGAQTVAEAAYALFQGGEIGRDEYDIVIGQL